jgi:hypothetical protein
MEDIWRNRCFILSGEICKDINTAIVGTTGNVYFGTDIMHAKHTGHIIISIQYPMFRYLFLFLTIIIFSCGVAEHQTEPGKRSNEFHFPLASGNWNITVPEGFTVEDSSAYFKRLGETAFQQPAESELRTVLLYAYDSAGVTDTIRHSLMLARAAWPLGASFGQYLQTSIHSNTRAFNLAPEFQQLADSSLSEVNISGQIFTMEKYGVRRGEELIFFRYYHAIRQNELLTAAIHYYAKDTLGQKLVAAFSSSKFE